MSITTAPRAQGAQQVHTGRAGEGVVGSLAPRIGHSSWGGSDQP